MRFDKRRGCATRGEVNGKVLFRFNCLHVLINRRIVFLQFSASGLKY